MNKYSVITLGVIQLVVGLGAIPAGLAMMFNPTGNSLGMSIEILKDSPFINFFIPGLFLFIGNGIFSLIAAFLTFYRYKHLGSYGILLGTFLISWILIQVYYIGLIHFLQPLFFILGSIELIISYKIFSFQKKQLP